MTTDLRSSRGSIALGILVGVLSLVLAGGSALAEEAAPDKEASRKMIRDMVEKATKKGGDKKKEGKKKAKLEPIVVAKPIWNQKSGFGLPVPSGWSAENEGGKVVLKSPDEPAKQTIITLGPEPTELEAEQYIRVLQKQIAEEKKTMPMPQKPRDILGKRIYIAAYLDSTAKPPGFGAMLVFDRPGDQVFVIRVLTRNEKIMNDYSVLASLGLIRFRGEAVPNLLAELGIGEKKKILDADELHFERGQAKLSEFRIPLLYKRLAEKKLGAKGDMHRFRTGIVAPKDYDRSRAWPVVFIDGPAEIETIEPYQKVADSLGVLIIVVQRQSENTVWPPEVLARVYFTALNKLRGLITADERRIYLATFGPRVADTQIAAALLPQAGAVIVPVGTDALSKALDKTPEAKKRLAAVAIADKANQSKAKALAEAWNKAGLKNTKVLVADKPDAALKPALEYLLKQDREQVKANLSKLMAEAAKLEKTQRGDALRLYRHIASAGLPKEQVAKANQAIKKLMSEVDGLLVTLKDKAELPAEKVMPMWETTQLYQGTPEGNLLLQAIRPKVEAQ